MDPLDVALSITAVTGIIGLGYALGPVIERILEDLLG